MLQNNIYLPYSIGVIISYIRSNIEIRDNYDINILYVKESIEMIDSKVKNPKYFFISVYMWNFQYSMNVAKFVKTKYPDCKIVLGGHHVPYFDIDFFNEYPYIDILVHGEGEATCEKILLGNSLCSINNLSFKEAGKTVRTNKEYNNCALDNIPSPYLTGVFDTILEDGYNFTASLETNRGCPFGCHYCDWGSTLTSQKKMRRFNKERVYKEIEWFGKNKIDFVFGTDSNFGIFKTDMDIVDKLIETKQKYGFPNKFRVCYTKNSDNFVFDINRKLNEFGLSKGATLSFQSLNAETMLAVGRKNMSLETFKKLLDKYNDCNIPTYTELILGLPEETFDSFADGICELLNMGQHTSIVVYNCQVYPNAHINTPEYRRKYGLKTIKIPMFPTHTTIKSDMNIDEEEIIIGTNKMTTEEWIETCMFSWCVQTMHCLGLCQVISRYLHEKHNIKYKDFYMKILCYAKNNPRSYLGAEYLKVRNKYINIIEGNGFKYINKPFGDLNWTFEEGSFLTFILDEDSFYNDIYYAVSDLGDVLILANLFKINKFLLKTPRPFKVLSVNKVVKNILDFLNIENDGVDTSLMCGLECYESLMDYAINKVWYGRKGNSMLYAKNEIRSKSHGTS